MPTLIVQDYQIGWICALNKELSAAMAMLDEEYEMIAEQDPQDHNSYVLGRIHQHHVVIACMPEGVDGLIPAATVAKDMARTFPALRFGLMVGIGGGIPDLADGIDIRLGDVVVSKPDKTSGGVVQYDKGKAENGGKFVRKGQLNQPPTLLLQTLTQLRARHSIRPSKMSGYMTDAIERNPMMEESGFTLPSEPDCLYCSGCDRDIESPAIDCQRFHGKRPLRKNSNPVAHYGLVASGNQVIKDAAVRDQLQAEFGALCVEMEAAGLMNEFPCLVIRGVCDYADRHKNDAWHPYAAMTAAAYAKELLSYITRAQASQEKPLIQIVGLMNGLYDISKEQTAINQKHLQATEAQTLQHKIHHENDLYRRCHQAFKIGPYEEQKDINPTRAPNTCKWVLNHPQYQHWRETLRDDLIWVSADPGCGKSVLAKSLIDYELRNTDNHTICYFFFKDIEEQDNLSAALCAILHQLFIHRPQLIRHAIGVHEKSGDKITKDLSELWRIWLAAARDAEAGSVTCVLDALDECREDDRRRLIAMLVDFYNASLSTPSEHSQIKILVTSRPYDDIQYHFGKVADSLPTIRLRGEDENDIIHDEIDLVVRSKVSELASEFKLAQTAVERLEAKILNMQHRTYLWLYLAIGSIRETYRDSLQPDRVVIDSLPSSVEAAYEGILNKITQSQRPTATLILEIIVGARRPLTIGEMALALGAAGNSPDSSLLVNDDIDVSHLERQIRVWCGLFIFVNHARLYLIHQTAKEFLLTASNKETVGVYHWNLCLDSMIVEKKMALICARFLLHTQIKWTIDRYGRKEPELYGDVGTFVVYTSENWPSHLRNAHITDRAFIQSLLPLYDTDSLTFRLWFPLFWDTQNAEEEEDYPGMNSIRLASFVGHEEVLRIALEKQQNHIDEADADGRTALYWASAFGHTETVRLLLARGADVDTEHHDSFWKPLHAAAEAGHLRVVSALLENDAKVNAFASYKKPALFLAVENKHIDIVKILLQSGADVQLGDWDGWTPLHTAACENLVPIMNLLIESGAIVDAYDMKHCTPLHSAADYGCVEAVRVLVDAGADVDARNDKYSTPLHLAVTRGHVEAVQVLLDAGADVETRDDHGSTPLHLAARNGYVEVVQVLLDAGADVDAYDVDHSTPLHLGVEAEQVEAVQVLLNAGADVGARDDVGSTPLHLAVRNRDLKTVQVLLAAGADRCCTNGEGKSPHQIAESIVPDEWFVTESQRSQLLEILYQ
ncbi:hypothetical protein H2200_011832 [Cladophialophora chaetospira]|uniref:NACHT domain-containing protein n=1 Tax=Cladophialophora chaetospira TaxID=386627 RepID=A0AA38WYT9_9EURO|nr:hypothetical protein H2200_011832 [Cladophialophora chaetospira]